MSVDIGMLNRIHDLENEIDETQHELKSVRDRRRELVSGLPEAVALEAAQQAVREAEDRLKLALQERHPDLERKWSALKVEAGEVAYRLKDLEEQHSHNLTIFTRDSGRNTIQDSKGRNREIELIARLSKPSKKVPNQTKMSFSQHFGVRQVIGEAPAVKQLQMEEAS